MKKVVVAGLIAAVIVYLADLPLVGGIAVGLAVGLVVTLVVGK